MSRFQPLDLACPIVLAPLAGGPSTPALAAAVSEAGGLGFLAAGYAPAGDLDVEIDAVRALTGQPFGVNLFVPGRPSTSTLELQEYAGHIRADALRLGVDVGIPEWDDDDWAAKIDLLIGNPVPVVSFTFGCPPAEVIDALQRAGSAVWVTVTEPDEASEAAAAGCDGLVVQGVEAGGHRGSFDDIDGRADLGLLPLLRLVARSADLPLVAAGGIGDGAGVAAVLAAGAVAAQLGTAFLLSAEAGTYEVHRQALARPGHTALTRAFTGRTARGVRNQFMRDHDGEAITAYPEVHFMTSPLRSAARSRGDGDSVNLWAGQAFELTRQMGAQELVKHLTDEARTALLVASERLSGGAAGG
jgi:nitronate monooxygenase